MNNFCWLLILAPCSLAIRCYQGQSGFGEERETVEIDCPERFHFCLKQTFYASEEMNHHDPIFYMCSGARECSVNGEYRKKFDENKIIQNVCCSTDLCNKNSASTSRFFVCLIFVLLFTRV